MALTYVVKAAVYTGAPRNTPDLAGIFQDVVVDVGISEDTKGLLKRDAITVEILNADSIDTARTKVTNAANAHVAAKYPNIV